MSLVVSRWQLGLLFLLVLSSKMFAASSEAELFGIKINDLEKSQFESHLKKMGLEAYPSYHQGVVTYSLGKEGILGIKNLSVSFNRFAYFQQATMSGVVENAKQRSTLGRLLVEKYGEPTQGFVRDGYGRATWYFSDGTMIQLRNTTFDVSVIYVDQAPKQVSTSGRIDVEALLRKSR
ncbi:uridine kinase [Maribrevibacterium harenarium]|uniref:Uridine kinase n=1 Tax=Maribrevibacterium harenarium TaxID=2589817 RepID=A0A501WS04_9GAMM|nr:uridine kinase [Maribrevibacterium harenarium]TPE50864.1 uridine kinase [Maribrevibacterium harenarium]